MPRSFVKRCIKCKGFVRIKKVRWKRLRKGWVVNRVYCTLECELDGMLWR